MSKLHLVKESLLATLLTLVVTFAISFIPLKYEFTKGIKQGFLGFDIYDLYYSGKKTFRNDTNIVLVQIEWDRAAIAKQIELLQKYSPAVIGIDVTFDRDGEPATDKKLLEAIRKNTANIVAASVIQMDSATKKEKIADDLLQREPLQLTFGYINFLGDTFSVRRNYPPFYKIGNSVYPAFTSAIIKKFSPEKFEVLLGRSNKTEIINYSAILENYINLSPDELRFADKSGQLSLLLDKKIVLLGKFEKEEPKLMDDIHFTPLNKRVTGKSFPDMYGVEIHANILSMIINADYSRQAGSFIGYLVAGVFTFSFLLFVFSQYKKKEHPSHRLFLVIQFIVLLLVLFLAILVFYKFRLKIPLLPVTVSMVLCVELLWLYRIIAKWFHNRYGYESVFNIKHNV